MQFDFKNVVRLWVLETPDFQSKIRGLLFHEGQNRDKE